MKTLMQTAPILAFAILLSGCDKTTQPNSGGIEFRRPPFANIAELEREGIPKGPFSSTHVYVHSNGLIELRYYVGDQYSNQELFNAGIAQARHLTTTLRKTNPIKVVFLIGYSTIGFDELDFKGDSVAKSVEWPIGS